MGVLPGDEKEAGRRGSGMKYILMASNITNTRKFEIKTPEVVIQVDPLSADLVETRVIDGRKCLVIPMEGEVVVNGVHINLI